MGDEQRQDNRKGTHGKKMGAASLRAKRGRNLWPDERF